jgi:hypothetical protein
MTPADVLAALESCWCQQLQDSLGGPPAVCCLTSGAPVVPECCGGFSWVRLIGAYPSIAFPQVAAAPQRCFIDTWALQVEVGITRCAPVPCDSLSAACCTAEADAAAILLDDFTRMRMLFTCGCIGLPSDLIIPGAFKVYGPEGGCIGGSITATIFSD